MGNDSIKIIIDTNLWISFLITREFVQLDEIINSKKCKLIFSKELFEEFLTVINRLKFRKYFSRNDTEELIEIIQFYAEFIDVKTFVEICRDEKDNFLLALAKDSEADYLITGDKDLLVLSEFASTKILTINEFLKK